MRKERTEAARRLSHGDHSNKPSEKVRRDMMGLIPLLCGVKARKQLTTDTGHIFIYLFTG